MRIGVIELFVDDQDKALAFSTGALGFEVQDDMPYGDGGRWLTVAAPADRDGTRIRLAPATGTAAALQAERHQAGTPALALVTDDCAATHRQLADRGVRFRSEPQRMAYGGIDAVFEDGCGNLLDLHQG